MRPRGTVVGAAILTHGRVLAARRTHPPGWEFPGGKVEPGEAAEQAVVREIREELGCAVQVTGWLARTAPIAVGLELRVATCAMLAGEPVPTEHDAVRWLGPEQLDDPGDAGWLPADRGFLGPLRALLLDGEALAGGNVGGAVRIGATVRRPTGVWTAAVHRLLDHLAERGVPAVPRVLGVDVRGREVLTYLPGRVVDVDRELLTEPQLVELVAWTRTLHDAAADFHDPGPWRFFDLDVPPAEQLVGHNDLAPYNCCFEGDRLVGVFDWDMAGPTSRVFDLAHLAWNAVPLFRPIGEQQAARRLQLVARTYDGPSAREILQAVTVLKRIGIAGIRGWIAAGDPAGLAQQAIGEPESTETALADLERRLPGIALELPL